MSNLLLDFNGQTTYSDGTYLPSANAGMLNNEIIRQSIAYNNGEVIAKAAINTTTESLPESLSELQKLNSGYIVVCDAEWVTIIRDRNIVRFIFEANHDTVERVASIIFKHNTEKEVYCEVSLTQAGEEYVLTVDTDEISFGVDSDSSTVGVVCTGGTGQYIVHGIQKYTIYTYGDGEGQNMVKRVAFDNAITATQNEENRSELIIKSNGSLILDDSYYKVTIVHKDMLGLTQTIKVTFPSYDRIDEIPQGGDSGESECPEETLLPISISAPPEEDVIPEIIVDDRDTDIVINSSDYSNEIEIVTVPQESQVYFIYYGDFIADYIISDYIDENDNLTHGLKIKAKPNPYGFGRNCIGYVINAMYPQVRKQLTIHQEGRT